MAGPDDLARDVLVYEPSKVSWVTAEFVRRPPAWTARAFIYCLAAALVALVLYASFATVAIQIEARGALATEPGVMPIVLPSTIKIASLNVGEQQVVQKGDVLIAPDEDTDTDLDRVRTQIAVAEAKGSVDPALTAELRALEARHARRNITAPIGGTVDHIAVSGVGQVVTRGTQVMEILPREARFIAIIAVANKDISRMKVGLPVIVRLDALPERTYGSINGTVESVPLTLTPSGDPNVPPAYAVVVALDRQSAAKGKDELPFRSGMQLDARIVTRHESMLVNFVHKLFSISDELGG
jgi:multidrug efflux pump subunit AcrA (membrane-fusion protein)